jgi:lipopolysaccharide export system permease protein
MATITRYIVVELLKVLVLWLGMFTLLMLFSLLFLEAQRAGIGAGIVLRIIPFILPQTLAYAIPATALLAVCVVYGRISAANEIVAVKSLGIGPIALAWPAFALAFVLSLVCVWLNDIAFSWGEVQARRVILQSVEEVVYGALRTRGVFGSKRLSIIVRGVEGRRLLKPVISLYGDENSDFSLTISADEAELQSNLHNDALKLILVNSIVDGGGSVQGEFPGRTEREIPLAFALTKGDLELGPSHISLRNMPEAIAAQRKKIREQHELLAAEMGFNLIAGDMLELNEADWQAKRQRLQSRVNRLYRLQSEGPRRLVSGFMCLFFTLVGVPLAIRMRTSDVPTTFLLAFGPILLGYFPFFVFALNYAKAGQLPAFTLWTANILCALVGWWLWRKVERY